MKQTIKIAELATFIYAFLFFGALCINMSYYAVFGINITAYVGLSEILLMFLSSPVLYIPLILIIVYCVLQPIVFLDNSHISAPKISVIRRGFQRMNTWMQFIFFAVLLLMLLIFKLRADIVISVFGIFIILSFSTIVFDNVIVQACRKLNQPTWEFLEETMRRFCERVTELFCKSQNNKNDHSNKKRALDILTLGGETNDLEWSKISRRKRMIKNYRIFFRYKLLYVTAYMYFLTILGASIIYVSHAFAYISEEKSPNRKVELSFDDAYINTKENTDYILIGECDNYIFIYNTKLLFTHIIPRDRINSLNIFIDDTIIKSANSFKNEK